jgi:hypothetical protein
MTDVMPEQQAVDLDDLAGEELAGTDDLDALDEQLIARLAGRPRRRPPTNRRGRSAGSLPAAEGLRKRTKQPRPCPQAGTGQPKQVSRGVGQGMARHHRTNHPREVMPPATCQSETQGV